jgi:hypothetical protein
VERSDDAEVDEASGSCAEWEWFLPDPDFPPAAAAFAERPRDWVTKGLARRAK